MRYGRRVILGFIAILFAGALILRDVSNRREHTEEIPVKSRSRAGALVPPYYESVRGIPVPQTLPADRFSVPKTKASYRAARGIAPALMQLPCYCWCDRIGHGSLLDCFVDEHAEFCVICQDSALWAEKRLKEQASIETVRQEIVDNYSRGFGGR